MLYALEKEKPRVSKATSKMVLSNRETFYNKPKSDQTILEMAAST